ncbi:aldo/keto reductase [Mucilaginibacter boryungensis]|uniref:Aldo/keto reductase n=1 Tax=Mucilaginibacter boryungensis TaxID=768480 RepID=A0ABR9XG05_9SPHI|nr:aldo/keto reductase [Mucilaginibacter boryungensis]MBE9666112.1 aldo/keto reductase [Mucilaginibacter boryungensis]
MKKRVLGKTGIAVSEIAFGGVEIGIPYGIGVNSEADMLSRDEAVSLLHEALDKGINFFDTARLYGESEAIMGEAFHDRRDRLVLATKCKHFKNNDGQIPSYQVLKKIIESSLEESLGLLKTDYVDVFMLHQADLEILANDDVKEIFTKLKDTGKVRAIGASTYTSAETKRAIEKGWDVIQLPFNLMDQQQADNFNFAEEKGTGIVVRSVLMKGLLSDKGRGLHPALQQVEQHIGKYRELLTDEIPEISTLATKFALSFKQVSAVLVGIDRSEYLNRALHSVDGRLLNAAELSESKALVYPDPSFLDLPQWDRLGWLK